MRDSGTVRCLSALRDASSARVLNLVAIEKANKDNPDFRRSPLFDSPVLNSCILLKHRLRSDEFFLFDDPQAVSTKIVIPFDKNDLRLGGTSFLYGQRGYLETMREAGKYGGRNFERDKTVLDLLHELPSLDPFLIHEQLDSNGIQVAPCYFDLSKADKMQMHEFAAGEIRELIQLAIDAGSSGKKRDFASAARLVSALLTTGAEDQLEPLRITLTLGADEFRQGIFSWRGFLYYKWSASMLLPKISDVAREITALPVDRSARYEELQFIINCKKRLVRKMSQTTTEVRKLLDVYDGYYAGLVHGGRPQLFRDFLLQAPRMFVQLGEKLGGLAHVTSFWRFRFPRRRVQPVDPETVISLYTDFMMSVGLSPDDLDMVA
ncbi:MAG: hypothetical protein ABSD74_06780 [Rhizomicrobium sp.]|jgi:hypothetical protein